MPVTSVTVILGTSHVARSGDQELHRCCRCDGWRGIDDHVSGVAGYECEGESDEDNDLFHGFPLLCVFARGDATGL